MSDDCEHDRILRMRDVLNRTGLSRSTIYRKIQEGTFPCQIEIGKHCCGWREASINRWISNPPAYRADEDTH